MSVTVFGEGAVQTAYVSFINLDITNNDLTLVWPTSYFDVPSEVNGIFYNVLAASMNVNNGPAKGISANMVAGSIVIPATSVAANSNIQLTLNTFGTAHGTWYVSAINPGVSFTVTSRGAGDGTETSTISWGIMPSNWAKGTSNNLVANAGGSRIFVNAPTVTENSNILLTYATNPAANGGVLSSPSAMIQPGVGFTIISSNINDTAQVNWVITDLISGINGTQGTSTLVAGTINVLNTSVAANSVILLSDNTLNTSTPYVRVSNINPGVSFTITAEANTDMSSINWAILSDTHTIILPDATESSVGYNFIITNIGLTPFQLLKSDKTLLISIPNTNLSNSYWVQLTDNSTPAGIWQFVQFGAGTSQAQASALAGNGLVPLGGLLNTNIPVKSIATAPYNVLVGDRANLLLWQTGVGNMVLPNIGTVPAGYYISVNNEGTGILTIAGNANIDNNVSITVSPNQSLSVISDGARWWTLGFGQNISSTNFAAGSSVAPSITFTPDTTTGIYYYQTPSPPVTPPGIGFAVSSTQVANMSLTGLFMNLGKSIILEDLTTVSQTILLSNVAYGQLSWVGPGLGAPATLRLSGTNTSTTMTLGPFAGLSISENAATATMSYNGNIILNMDAAGLCTFAFPVTFSSTTIFTLTSTFNGPFVSNNTATFNNPVTFNNTVTLSAPLPQAQGGTGQITQQLALNALMPPTPVIGDLIFYNGTNWVRLPVGAHVAGATLQLVGVPPIPTWVP